MDRVKKMLDDFESGSNLPLNETDRIFSEMTNKELCLYWFAVGFRLFLQRTKKNTSEIAKKLNTTLASVSAWKNGKNFPSFDKIVELIKLGMSTEEIFSGEINEINNINSENVFTYEKSKGLIMNIKGDHLAELSSKLEILSNDLELVKKAFGRAQKEKIKKA